MNLRTHDVLVVVLLGLSACSNPKDASDENFAAALNRELADDRECLRFKLPAEHYPARKGETAHPDGEQQALDALVAKGLLAKRTETKPDWRGIKAVTDIYELTKKGEEFVPKDKVRGFLESSNTELCYGVGKVEEVTNFSAPNSVLGQTVSVVHYTYKVRDVTEWANEPALLQFEKLASAVRGEAIARQESLMLTGNGWQTHDEFQRGQKNAAATSAR